jgi:hypothetical protein
VVPRPFLTFSLLAAVAAVSSVNAAQPAPEPAASDQANRSAPDDNDRLDPTKNVRPPTGARIGSSRTRQRVCQTRQQWDEQERAAQQAIKVRDRGVCSPGECSG